MTKFEGACFSFDAASAISQGAREYQEDAIISDFSNGSDLGFVVLADGMGGHAAGDVASKIVVTQMFNELTFLRGDMAELKTNVADALQTAALSANDCLKGHVASHPQTKGMGATLVSTVIIDGQLHWISVGDSPLYLFRNGTLVQLNEDHSMAQTIDLMVLSGALSEAEGNNHPDRNVLTSVLFGEPIPRIDCPTKPVQLRAGDILIVASDGLQFLDDKQIEGLLRDRPFSPSCEIADVLMMNLKRLNDPDLDNISMSVVQVRNARQDDFAWRNDAQATVVEPERPSLFRNAFKPRAPGASRGGRDGPAST